MNIKKNKMIILYIVMFIVYPLFMTNGYKNTTVTKCISFALITGVAFFVLAWKDYEKYVTQNGGIFGFSIKNLIRNLSVPDKAGAAFVLASLVSFIFAKYRSVAFNGSSDSYMGLFTVIVMAMIYFVAENHFTLDEIFVLIASAGGALSAVFSIIQFMGADLFGLFSQIEGSADHIYNFLSTLGNTSVFGQYLVLILPLAITGYCKTQNLKKRLFFAASSDIMIMGIMVANVDAAYLGLAVICALSAIIFWRKKTYFVRTGELFCQALGSVVVLKIIYSVCKGARGRSAITRGIMNVPAYIYVVHILILAAAVYIINRKIENEKFYTAASKIAQIIIFIIVVACAALFIYLSAVDRESKLFGLEKYFRFSDNWGTDRGYVWKWLITIFAGAGPLQKLFGAGQGSIVFELFAHYKVQMISVLKYYFDNAHNVYLHLLFTLGIFGIAAYLSFIISSIYSGIKKAAENEYMWGAVISISAYAVVDFFSVLQPITIGLYISLVALVAAKKK